MDDIDRLERDLRQAPDRLHGRTVELVRSSTLACEAIGKGRAPVRTGHLKGSITSEFAESATTVRGETGPEAEYGWFVEHGTRHMAPQPYMGPAADIVEPAFYAGAAAVGASVLDARGSRG